MCVCFVGSDFNRVELIKIFVIASNATDGTYNASFVEKMVVKSLHVCWIFNEDKENKVVIALLGLFFRNNTKTSTVPTYL